MPKDTNDYSVGPPWKFTGSAVYQLHLVKSDIAKRIIPSQLKIVEAFGYTLGGFFFAQYDSSPAGKFDELVALAGIVWNPPTSCAWASRVLVNSISARDHGIAKVGLPSKFATFDKEQSTFQHACKSKNSFSLPWKPRFQEKKQAELTVHVADSDGPLCQMQLPPGFMRKSPLPRIKMALPSFSGLTANLPDLLYYSCDLQCRVKIMGPVKCCSAGVLSGEVSDSIKDKDLLKILTSKPVMTIMFQDMEMLVEAPVAFHERKQQDGRKWSQVGKGPGFAGS